MVDGELPLAPGLVALVFILFLLALTVSTSSGSLQGTIFVVALVGLGSFSYLAEQFELAELRKFETERVDRGLQ